MRIPALTYADARLMTGARWVDLRSPAEFARDHLPGAASVPLLDDDERALVGTLYKQVSPHAAFDRGLDFAAARLPALLTALLGQQLPEAEWRERFAALASRLREGAAAIETELHSELPNHGQGWILLHCWRGGMRSRSVAALLQSLGSRVAVLEGGYKAYRSWVLDQLAAWPAPGPSPFILISGPTGTGKTLLLRRLEVVAPGSSVDLEACADHRSSILGAVGRSPVSQAAFESRLAARIELLGPPPWFIEAESRKVGDSVLPEPLWRAMREGWVVELGALPETRVRILVDDYLETPNAAAEIGERLPFLEERLGEGWSGRLMALLQAGRHGEIAALLLEHYYDPLYRHSGRNLIPRMELQAEDPARVERLLAARAAWRESAIAGDANPVELTQGSCADSSELQVFPAATLPLNSMKA